MSPPLLHIPNKPISSISTKRSSKSKHGCLSYLAPIGSHVVVTFVFLVFVAEGAAVLGWCFFVAWDCVWRLLSGHFGYFVLVLEILLAVGD